MLVLRDTVLSQSSHSRDIPFLQNWSFPATLDAISGFNQAHDNRIHSRRPRARAKDWAVSRGALGELSHLDKAMSDLEAQLKGGGDTASAFSALKDRVSAFFKRLSESAHG